MEEENYLKDIEIISEGDKCESIIFIAQGKIEIEVHHDGCKGEGCQVIEVLKKGDIIGYKSILFDANFQFSAVTIENTRIFVLKKSYFDVFKNKIQGLNDLWIKAIHNYG
jgi:CRP-like cAMP-binding protein